MLASQYLGWKSGFYFSGRLSQAAMTEGSNTHNEYSKYCIVRTGADAEHIKL